MITITNDYDYKWLWLRIIMITNNYDYKWLWLQMIMIINDYDYEWLWLLQLGSFEVLSLTDLIAIVLGCLALAADLLLLPFWRILPNRPLLHTDCSNIFAKQVYAISSRAILLLILKTYQLKCFCIVPDIFYRWKIMKVTYQTLVWTSPL